MQFMILCCCACKNGVEREEIRMDRRKLSKTDTETKKSDRIKMRPGKFRGKETVPPQKEVFMDRVLLHCCCAPCSLSCIEPLRAEGIEPTAFWYNPNIHPWKEYEARRDCLLAYAPTIGMEVRVREDYGLREFVEHVAEDIAHRCTWCYEHRLEQTAKYAAERGFDSFTTTLLASVYQRHELIAAAGERFAAQYGVRFLYRDFRPNFRAGNQRARELGFYMQKYCGCVFSEEERYQKQIARARERFEEHAGE